MTSKAIYTLSLLVIAQAAISSNAFGQAVSVIPGQVSQLPPPPVTQRAIPDIRIQRPGVAAEGGPTGPAVVVSSLHITGETRFSEAELIAVTGFAPGRALTLSDLRRMAALIANYYNTRGYVVAQAYVPAQEITDGAVTIVVIEGHYGAVDLRNGAGLHSVVARRVLDGLDKGDIVAAAPLERRLLLLSDI